MKFKPISPALERLGFQRPSPVRLRRIIMAIQGRIRTGKTRFALTARQQIGYVNFDRSVSDALAEIPETDIVVQDLTQMIPVGELPDQPQAIKIMERFEAGWHALLKVPEIRTMVVDSFSEVWVMARLAEFGKKDGVKPHHFGPVNTRMRRLLLEAQAGDKNVILLHRMQEEWEDRIVPSMKGPILQSNTTGRWIREGFKHTDSLVHMTATMSREDSGERRFLFEVHDCAFNSTLAGHTFVNEDINFPGIASMVHLDTEETDWR